MSRKPGALHLHIRILGAKEGLRAVEEASFAGIPMNVTLLFSRW